MWEYYEIWHMMPSNWVDVLLDARDLMGEWIMDLKMESLIGLRTGRFKSKNDMYHFLVRRLNNIFREWNLNIRVV